VHIVIIGKFPPIQGGVSTQTYWAVHELAKCGHVVHVVTNANEVEYGLRHLFWGDDIDNLNRKFHMGSINVHTTTTLSVNSFIPWTNPFGSKLFGLAISVVEKYGCDLLIGWYFEPYGLTAAQIGHIYRKPVIIVHAGSDLGFLTTQHELVKSYEWMLKESTTVVTGGEKLSKAILDNLKVSSKKRVTLPLSRLPEIYSKLCEPLDMSVLLSKLPKWYRRFNISKEVMEGIIALNRKVIDFRLPIIGIYGKVGRTKGNYELIEALEILSRRGLKFNFVCISASNDMSLEKYYRALLAKSNLVKMTWVLPAIAPWRIPSFLRLCNVLCFLEHDFQIAFHGPRVPREVLAAGSCLVCSSEIAKKQPFKESLIDGKNYISIPDPKNITYLANRIADLVLDKQLTYIVGKHGQMLSKFIEDEYAQSNPIMTLINNYNQY